MDHLKDIYRCKEQIELELKQVSKFVSAYPKRFKPKPRVNEKTKRFESALLRLKTRWNQSISALFQNMNNQAIYDKLAYDLTKSFHTFYAKYKFDGDQLSYAFRCLILPIVGQIMDENELGRQAYERQERRKYLVKKLLSYGIPENLIEKDREESPGSDDPVDVCSTSPANREDNHGDDIDDSITMRNIRPTPVTIIIVDILVEALMRHNPTLARNNSSGKDRIFHVMNITHIVDLIGKSLEEVRVILDDEKDQNQSELLNKKLLSTAMERYEVHLWETIDMFTVAHPMTVYKSQLDIILLQVTTIKPMLLK